MNAGYAKFETFPVWALPLKHPVNIAYEAATADLGDKNMIDYFHLEKYGVPAVNYNRDLETFPVLKEILRRITGKTIYYSPTDMGVNVIGECITDDKAVQKAAKDEIVRRYYRALTDLKKGLVAPEVPERIKLLHKAVAIRQQLKKRGGQHIARGAHIAFQVQGLHQVSLLAHVSGIRDCSRGSWPSFLFLLPVHSIKKHSAMQYARKKYCIKDIFRVSMGARLPAPDLSKWGHADESFLPHGSVL